MKILLSIFFICIFFVSCFPDIGFDRNKNTFQSKKWKALDKEGGERETMLGDLEKKLLSKHPHKSSILDSLGTPDKVENLTLMYLISLGFDPCYLRIKIDKSSNKLDTFEVRCD